MKKWVLIACLVFNALFINAQNRFGNEWIKPGQQYLKFTIEKASIYRITYQDIQSVNTALLQTNPSHWQLFFRGQEIAIRVVGQDDGVFDAQDYIEFYAEGNDGSLDSLVYRPQKRLHPYQTLFSDKAYYFLTSSPTQTGKRMAQVNVSSQGLTAEPFHMEENVQAFTSEYTFNNLKSLEPYIQASYFEPGEGWSGPLLTADSVGVVQLKFTNRATTTTPITIEGMVNGRDNTEHTIQVQRDNVTSTPFTTLKFYAFSSQTFQQTLEPASVQNEQVTLRFKPDKPQGFYTTNNFSVTYVKLTYPQRTDMTGLRSKTFHLPARSTQAALLSIANAPSAAIAYDITDKANCRLMPIQTVGEQRQIAVNDMLRSRSIFVSDQQAKPAAIQSVRFQQTFPKDVTYLLITHATLKQSANEYATYRSSVLGGNHKTYVVEADSLYDQFNYGEKGPLAIRRFADFMQTQSAIKNLLLVGRACSYPYLIKTTKDDLVPTFGYPGSDILLTAGLQGHSQNTPSIPTGRLNVTTNEQVLAYLEKVKQMENTLPNGPWRKHIIHISGGKSQGEAESLRSTLSNLGTVFKSGLLGGEVSAFSKNNAYEEVEQINITPLVNDGVGMITFFGHAGPAITDMNFGFASPVQNGYRNKFYPFMIFNGCGVGEIFSTFNTLSTDWLLAPEKGSALILAHSYLSYEQPTTKYLQKLYAKLFTEPNTLGRPFGEIQQQLNQELDQVNTGTYDTSVMLEMLLQGDPALSLYPLPNPDYTIDSKGIYIQSSVAGSPIKTSDSVQVVIPLVNLGKFVAGQSVPITINQTKSAGSTTTTLRTDAFRYRDTLVYTIAKDETLKKIDVIIDAGNQLSELDKTNNTASLAIDWAKAESSSSYPINSLPDRVSPTLNVFIDGAVKKNNAVVGTNPTIDIYLLDENTLAAQDTSAIEMYLKRCETCNQEKVPAQSLTFTSLSANQLHVTAKLSLQPATNYELIIVGKDAAGNRTQPPYIVNVNTLASDEPIVIQTYPNPATTYTKFELTLNVQDLPVESRLMIYTLTGNRILDTVLPVSTGSTVFLWQGAQAGLYPYSLQLTWKDGRVETRTGKVLWQP
ncbi:hypothetical protein GCM10028806_10020 [Spirosoma terrae]|uniref:Gingipain domain-containing protein n=1 Tax=Spirosoma terrae TaxID=1968276 RepID=A0A6L9L5M2_9BACT|nr:C25 family cysteine peptidase [Spirosoma terrae]NDU95856.1 hypothetical protein [Spirosoma terrae]